MSSVHDLPNELLLSIFEAIFTLYDSTTSYPTLLSAAQVCRLWGDAARQVLLYHVEVTRRQDVESLLQVFERLGSSSSVETLVAGVGGTSEPNLIDDNLFLRLLSHTPRLRKLVVLHQNSLGCISSFPPLPYLTDVTINAAGNSPAVLSETTLIRQLPPSVRFLTLPGQERTRFVSPEMMDPPPSFKLFGLSVQEFPTPTTKWVLSESSESLQCLTVNYIAKLDQVAAAHPNLRSLKVLCRMTHTGGGFANFHKLERLEIRDLSVKDEVTATLPPSLKYLRCWSGEVASKVAEMVLAGRLPNLRTLVWDYPAPSTAPSQAARLAAHDDCVRRLKEACGKNEVDLRLYERKDLKRAGKGKDVEYESNLRASCFRLADERPTSSHFDLGTTRLPVRILRDMMSSGLPLAPPFKSLSPFFNNIPGLWPSTWEDSYDGHSQWLEETLPKVVRSDTKTSSKPSTAQCYIPALGLLRR